MNAEQSRTERSRNDRDRTERDRNESDRTERGRNERGRSDEHGADPNRSDPRGGRRLEVTGSGGIRLAVWEQGDPDAETVLFIHGYPDSHTVWDLVVDRLVDDHHVVTYDVRGAGGSDAPRGRSGYHLDHLVTDIEAVIEATSPDRPVHLVAHDWGSIQAWSAVLHPEIGARIASFTSMSGPGVTVISEWIRNRLSPGDGHWRELSRQAVRSWYILAFQNPLAPLAWRVGLARNWRWFIGSVEGVPTDERWPAPTITRDASNGVRLYQENLSPLPRPGHRRPGAPHGIDYADTTRVPVQLVVATGDSYVTPELLDDVRDVAPDLTRVRIAGGHWLPRTNPVELSELIRSFVDANRVTD